MYLGSLEVQNIKGIAHIAFKFGTVTDIRGANGTGKSSIVDAVMMFFAGGSDPGWLRKGADKGFARLEVLDDDGAIVAIMTKTIAKKKKGDGYRTDLEILDEKGVPIPEPQTFINELGPTMAVDPARILAIDTSKADGKKQLIALLLKLMPIEFSAAELTRALGERVAPSFSIPPACDLDGLAKLRKQVEEYRRRVGIEARDSEGTVADLRRSLPADDGTDWSAVVELAERKLSELTTEAAQKSSQVRSVASNERSTIRDQFLERETALRAEFEQKLAELRTERDAVLAEAKRLEDAALAEISETAAPVRDQLTAELATARESLKAQHKAQGVRDQIEKFTAKVKARNCEYERLSSALVGLDDAKKAKLDSLPVPGMEFSGDHTLVDGVEWEHVNRARRAEVAVQLSYLQAGKVPFLVLDDAEHLDSETRQDLLGALVAAGFQVMLATVSDGALEVQAA